MKNHALFQDTLKTAVLTICFYFAISITYASDMDQQLASNIYNFQVKLAKAGNPHSQTKVGEMLEAGNGVKRDIKQAKHWYQLAAKSGYEPAQNRLKFLAIETHGYDKSKDAAWVEKIKSLAAGQGHDAMLLLAQMYRKGIGVKKNYDAASQLLNPLTATGGMIVDFEKTQLDAAIRADKTQRQALVIKQATQQPQASKQSDKKKLQAIKEAQKDAAKAKAVTTTKQETEAEKRKRYEAVMKKLRDQQKIIDQQQKWAESENPKS